MMGVLPLQFMDGEGRESLGLTGREEFSISGIDERRGARGDRAGEAGPSSAPACGSTRRGSASTSATAGSCATCCADSRPSAGAIDPPSLPVGDDRPGRSHSEEWPSPTAMATPVDKTSHIRHERHARARHVPGTVPGPGPVRQLWTKRGTLGTKAPPVRARRARAYGWPVPEAQPPLDPPLLVVVTGPPATGKSTVAEELAKRLRVPFISKDLLKETLYDTFGYGDDVEEKLDRAALALLFTVVGAQLEAGVSVVAESNFDAETDTGPFRRIVGEQGVRLVQIHCHASSEAILTNFADRAESGRRHPGHQDEPEDVKELRAKLDAGLWDPLDLPGELIELPVLETDVDHDAVARHVRELAAHASTE